MKRASIFIGAVLVMLLMAGAGFVQAGQKQVVVEEKAPAGVAQPAKPAEKPMPAAPAEPKHEAKPEKPETAEAETAIKVDKLQDIKNPEAGFGVTLWVDKKEGVYKVGEEVVFGFTANKDCRVTLLHVGTTGKVQCLFPNQYQKDNLVKAGEKYFIPPKGASWMYKAQAPEGTELVKAIATVAKLDLVKVDEVKPAGGVQEVQKTETELAREIAIELRPVNKLQWAESEKLLEIRK